MSSTAERIGSRSVPRTPVPSRASTITAARSRPWPKTATSRATGRWTLAMPASAAMRSQLRAAAAVRGRMSAATTATTTCPPAPFRASRRAATKPSPPLLPGPHRMTIGPDPQRSVSAASARTAAATAVPACSMSRSSVTPRACARRSAPVIASAPMGGSAARSAQRERRPRRSRSNSVGSSAGSGTPGVVARGEAGVAGMAAQEYRSSGGPRRSIPSTHARPTDHRRRRGRSRLRRGVRADLPGTSERRRGRHRRPGGGPGPRGR